MSGSNIFQQYLRPPKSVMDYSTELDQADNRRQSLQQNALTLAAARHGFAETQQAHQRTAQLRGALQGLPQGATDEQRIQAMRATGSPEGFAAADALSKSLVEQRKGSAAAKKDESDAADADFKLKIAKHEQALRDMSGFQSPAEVLASLQQSVAAGDIAADRANMYAQQLQTMNPVDFPKWQLGMVRQLMAAKDQMSYLAPDANTLANNATSRANNAATVAASRDNAAATRDVAKATRDAASIRRGQDTEMKLADDYRIDSKGFAETSTAMKKVFGAISTADKNPGSALAAGTAFMKLLDPNSVVRESELGMALNASGWFDRATHLANTLQNGKTMTAAQQKNLRAAAEDLFEEAKAAQREIDGAYQQRATGYGVEAQRVIVDRGQNAPRASAAQKQGAAPAKSAASGAKFLGFE